MSKTDRLSCSMKITKNLRSIKKFLGKKHKNIYVEIYEKNEKILENFSEI